MSNIQDPGVDLDLDQTADIASQAQPVGGYIVDRVIQEIRDDDGNFDGLVPQILVLIDGIEDAPGSNRAHTFTLDGMRGFIEACQIAVSMWEEEMGLSGGNRG